MIETLRSNARRDAVIAYIGFGAAAAAFGVSALIAALSSP
jgi:hypothetical protein